MSILQQQQQQICTLIKNESKNNIDMILLLAFIAVATFIIFVLLEPEKESYDGFGTGFFIKFLIKFIFHSIRNRKQGNVSLPKSLIYAAAGGQDGLTIQPKNHHLRINNIRINSMNLKNYRTLCGYKRYDAGVPVCYAETLFIKGILLIITSSKFCLSPTGLIHLRQTIKQLQPLEEYLNSAFVLDLKVQEYRQLTRGVEVDIDLKLLASGSHLVWEGTVTLFSRGQAARSGARRNQSFSREKGEEETCDEVIHLDVPSTCGIEYARLSGDWNPFHLYKWSAQLFGFRLPIAHGMWTLSRALAEFQKKGYDLYNAQTEVSCAFKRPLFMPGRASIKIDDFSDVHTSLGADFTVEERDTGVPHLKANVKLA